MPQFSCLKNIEKKKKIKISDYKYQFWILKVISFHAVIGYYL